MVHIFGGRLLPLRPVLFETVIIAIISDEIKKIIASVFVIAKHAQKTCSSTKDTLN